MKGDINILQLRYNYGVGVKFSRPQGVEYHSPQIFTIFDRFDGESLSLEK